MTDDVHEGRFHPLREDISWLRSIKHYVPWYPNSSLHSSSEWLTALAILTLTLLPSLLRFPLLHLALIRVLRWIEDVHRPLATNRSLDDDRQSAPYRLRHRNQDASIVKILLVLWPADALFVALLRSWTLLQRQTGKEEEQRSQEDETNTAGVESCVSSAVG